MAPLTTATVQEILKEDLKVDLGDYYGSGLTDVKCLMPTTAPGRPQCTDPIGKDIIGKIQRILDTPVTYLEGDKVNILDAIERLASHLVHPKKHNREARDDKVGELTEKYCNTMKRHFEAKMNEGSTNASTDSLQVLKSSVVEEESLPITPSSTDEITQAIEVGEVIYPTLPRTYTFTIEDKEEVTTDSSDEPHLNPHPKKSNDPPCFSLANLSTPPLSKEPILSTPISNNISSNNLLLSLILRILQQLYVGLYTQVHIKWGQEAVENTSGQIENGWFTELKIFFGLRVATRSSSILLCIVLFGIYHPAWGILGCLAFYVLVSVGLGSLVKLNTAGSEVVV